MLLCTGLRDAEELRLIVEREIHAVCDPFALDGDRALSITASTGAVVTSDPEVDPDHLLDLADRAMYAAKRAADGRIEIYVSGAGDRGVGARNKSAG